MDFTLTTYKELLQELLGNAYSFQTLQDFIQLSENKTIIFRHDVDRLPNNALRMANLENRLGKIRGRPTDLQFFKKKKGTPVAGSPLRFDRQRSQRGKVGGQGSGTCGKGAGSTAI